MIFQDFLLDEDGDLLIQNGDFVVGPSDVQHVEDIIQSFLGEWKQFPFVGVGLLQYIKSEDGQKAVTSIKEQLQADGYSLTSVNVKNSNDNAIVSFPNGIKRNL